MATHADFQGFPADAILFFDELEENNNREWFLQNRSRYDSLVRGPIDSFLMSVAAEFGTAHVFRPNRDTRFAHDKSPYKTNIGAICRSDAGAIYYIHFDGGGLMAASGHYMMSPDQIQRYRVAVADAKTGPQLSAIVDAARASGMALHEPALKRVPSPFGQDHPRGELLRLKSVTLSKQFGMPKWASTKSAQSKVVDVWRSAGPLNQWLAAHVGPSVAPQA